MSIASSRREIKTRNAPWAQQFAARLANAGISPNAISLFSMFFSALALGAFILAQNQNKPLYLVLAVLGIQGRLLCNLFDGMVAVEFNKKSPLGDLYNEVPDRISDTLILLGAGIVCKDIELGIHLAWVNIFLATMTAYIRVFGASLGLGHHFIGPMAKQHRMFLLSVAALLQSIISFNFIYWSLIVMLLGLLITVARRLGKISRLLKGINL